MTGACATDFDDWLVGMFGQLGAFTMLIVLVEISATSVVFAPVFSSACHRRRDEVA